ncbi:MAG TPA: ABC transporter permease [Oculatellaceae cyanobacterium]|jgi:lipooligosaccharide transport system permease protein
MNHNLSITPWGVYSVWRRHFKVYQNTWLVNFLPPMLEPLIYLTAFGLGLTPLVGAAIYADKNVSYIQFIAPGMIAIAVLSQSYFEGAYGSFIRLKFQKIWQALLTAPLTFTEVFLGDLLWCATRGLISGVITGVVAVSFGLYSVSNLLLCLPLLILGSILFASLGVLTAGLVRSVDEMNVPFFVFVVPMYNICGTFFPREVLPPILRNIARVLPLSPLVDLLRWPLEYPKYWLLELVWMIVLLIASIVIAWKRIYPQLFR